MTATALPSGFRARTGPSRIADIARLHIRSWPILVIWPLVVLALIVLALVVIVSLAGVPDEMTATGAASGLSGFVLAFSIQAMTQTLPFALGLGATRRDFFVATTAVTVGIALVYTLAMQTIATIEDATNGYGVNIRVTSVAATLDDSVLVQMVVLFATILLIAAVGQLLSVVFLRWRGTGLFVAGVATVAALIATAAVIGLFDGWGALIDLWRDTPGIVTLGLFPLALTVVAWLGTGALLRGLRL